MRKCEPPPGRAPGRWAFSTGDCGPWKVDPADGGEEGELGDRLGELETLVLVSLAR